MCAAAAILMTTSISAGREEEREGEEDRRGDEEEKNILELVCLCSPSKIALNVTFRLLHTKAHVS